MPNQKLDEREFELINICGANLSTSQRDFSRHMNLSLGMVNMLIRRLISKGYIRISQLNKKKVNYILTPKGFTEKMRKSIKYTLKTINSISLIKERIKEIVVKRYEDGERDFIVFGKSDFALLIEIVFKEMGLSDYSIQYVDEMPSEEAKGVILICKENVNPEGANKNNTINLIYELAKYDLYVNYNRE